MKKIKDTKEIATKTPSILKKARITEKAANSVQVDTYIFDVNVNSTKNEISKAFFAQFKHKPVRVNTSNQKAKIFFRKGILGASKKGKKAYITVKKGVKIEVM